MNTLTRAGALAIGLLFLWMGVASQATWLFLPVLIALVLASFAGIRYLAKREGEAPRQWQDYVLAGFVGTMMATLASQLTLGASFEWVLPFSVMRGLEGGGGLGAIAWAIRAREGPISSADQDARRDELERGGSSS